MTSAPTGKFTAARVAVILFSASLMGGFVWYSHIKAQPADAVTTKEEATTRPMILPDSERANVTIVPDDIKVGENGASAPNLEDSAPVTRDGTPPPSTIILSGSKSFAGPVISTNQGILTIGKGESEVPVMQGSVGDKQRSTPRSQAMIGSSKGLSQMPIRTEELSKVAEKEGQPSAKVKGTGVSSNSSVASGTGDGQLVPLPVSVNPPKQPARPPMFSGSKTFAGPVVHADQLLDIVTLGNGSKEASPLSLPAQISVQRSPHSSEDLLKLVEKGELPPALPRNQKPPIFTSSKSGPIFTPQLIVPPSLKLFPDSKSPPPEDNAQTETGPQPQTDAPAPASP